LIHQAFFLICQYKDVSYLGMDGGEGKGIRVRFWE
jgi:hypothetical protein